MMNKYDRVAADVSTLLSQVSDIDSEKLTAISAEYTTCVSEVNVRLRNAVSLLHKGLRDEAIQECEREPNLLDAFEALDVHEQELWRSMHRSNRVPLPPPMLLQQAAELNGAYALQAPLTELLRKHRLLALGHAPLEHRIQILHQIANKDPSSEIWHTDIKAYETERIAEIKNAISKVRQTGDLAAIQSLYREVHSPDRIVPAPDEVKSQVGQLLHELEIQAARSKLKQCSLDLQAAFSEFDLERGLELQDQWELYLAPAKMPPEDGLLVETQPALDWLAEQQQKQDLQAERETLLANFESLLEDELVDRNELETTYTRLSASGAEVPNVLVRRYRNRMQTIQTRERRAQTLKLVGVIGAIAICGGAVFAGLRGLQSASKVREAATLLSSHRTNRQWQEGLGLIESTQEISPQVFQSTSFQNEKTRFQRELDNDQARISDFDSLNEDIQIGGITIEDATKITKMGGIAITAEEKQTIAELKRKMELHDAEKESQAKTQFNAAIDQVNRQFQETENPSVDQLKKWLAEIQAARDEHPYALRDRQQAVGVADRDQILESRIQQRVEEDQKAQDLSKTIARVNNNLGRSLSVHISLLKELSSALGETEAGKELADTQQEKSVWMLNQSVSKALSKLPSKIELTNTKQAQQALAGLNKLKAEFGELPTDLKKLEKHLVAVGKRPELIQVSRLVPQPIRKEENAILTDRLLELYQNVGKDNATWEVAFRNSLDTILAEQSVDPLLRLRLYEVALNRARAGSEALADGFQDVQKRINSEEKKAILQNQSTEDATIFLSQLPHEEAKKRHVTIVKELRMAASNPRWAGWIALDLTPNAKDVLLCQLTQSVPNGRLIVLTSKDEKPERQLLGSVRNGKVQVDNAGAMKLGRPVFWTK